MFRDLKPLGYEPSDARYAAILVRVMGIFDREKSQTVPWKKRIEAAEVLGQVADPRLAHTAPNRWIKIPGGKYWRGAQSSKPHGRNFDLEADEDESPVHEVTLAEFEIAKYPVTVGEFQLFVEHEHYNDKQYWKAGGFHDFKEPENWPEQLPFPNRPVVGVSWYEAMAYCKWARCKLPTEAQWERAARGTDGRKYPWGNEDPDNERCNYNQNVGAPSPVGIFPRGATPDGIDDLAGNVWEWCSDWKGPYQTEPRENPVGPENGTSRVLRGGSWIVSQGDARSAVRSNYLPAFRSVNVGFRLVGVCGQDSSA